MGVLRAIVGAALIFAALPVAQAFGQPVPRDRVLTFDFPGVRIGTAEYEAGPTGATVFYFPKPVMAAVDVRGGAPGTINTDALRLAYDEPFVDAITFAAGSSYGLSVATGVAEALKAQRKDPGDWTTIPFVTGAIIFDLGPRRFTSVTPDAALGRQALAAAREGVFPLGAAGAGRFATQGGYFDARTNSGQGAAVRQAGPTKVAVFTVVNALGHVVDRGGRVVRCAGPTPDECGTIGERTSAKLRSKGALTEAAPQRLSGNTTLTLVLTNQKLPVWALQRLAVQVHASLGRAIQPYSTTNDGDVLFAATTGEVDNPQLQIDDLGLLASETAWDAVISSVPQLNPPPARGRSPAPAELRRYVGRYEFAPGMHMAVSEKNGQLWARGPARANLYLPLDKEVTLTPVNATDFRIPGTRGDWLRFEASGATINPGKWPVRARRVSGSR